MTEAQKELYTKTVTRLARMGAKDPTAQIIALAEEVEHYRNEIHALEDALLREQMKAGDQYLRLTPEKPIEEADDFGDRSLCCPHCIGPVTNYWAPGAKPKHCQFCGQALDWGEETNQ